MSLIYCLSDHLPSKYGYSQYIAPLKLVSVILESGNLKAIVGKNVGKLKK